MSSFLIFVCWCTFNDANGKELPVWQTRNILSSKENRHHPWLRQNLDSALTSRSEERRRLQGLVTSVANSLIAVVTPTLSEQVQFMVTEYYDTYDFDVNLGYETDTQFLVDVSWRAPIIVEETENDFDVLTDTNTTDTSSVILNNATFGNDDDDITSSPEIRSSLAAITSDPSFCQEEANIDYKVQAVENVGKIQMDSIEFVPGSSSVEMTFQNLKAGAEWSGEWIVKTTFPSLTATTRAKMTPSDNSECRLMAENTVDSTKSRSTAMSEVQTVEGRIHFIGVTTETRVKVYGETERIAMFASSSQVSSGVVQNFQWDYDSLDASQAGTFPTPAGSVGREQQQPIQIATFLEQSNIARYMEDMTSRALQGEIDYILPHPLLGD